MAHGPTPASAVVGTPPPVASVPQGRRDPLPELLGRLGLRRVAEQELRCVGELSGLRPASPAGNQVGVDVVRVLGRQRIEDVGPEQRSGPFV